MKKSPYQITHLYKKADHHNKTLFFTTTNLITIHILIHTYTPTDLYGHERPRRLTKKVVETHCLMVYQVINSHRLMANQVA